jgi:hypothetical protein
MSSPPHKTPPTPPGSAVAHCSHDQHCYPRLMTVFLVIYLTKCGDSLWRWCFLMSSIAYPKFSLSSHPRRPRSCSHQCLLPVLDLTSTHPGKSIHVLINSFPFWMHLSYRNVFPDVSYVSQKWFPKIHPDAPRNACSVQNGVGRVCRVITPWSPTQVIIHHHHLVFIMLHITEDSIVQTFLDSCHQSSGTCKSFPRCLQTSQIESTQP